MFLCGYFLGFVVVVGKVGVVVGIYVLGVVFDSFDDV